jgi:hypothetical protein
MMPVNYSLRISLAMLLALAPVVWCCCGTDESSNVLKEQRLEQFAAAGEDTGVMPCCAEPASPVAQCQADPDEPCQSDRTCGNCAGGLLVYDGSSAVALSFTASVNPFSTPPWAAVPFNYAAAIFADTIIAIAAGGRPKSLAFGGDSLRTLSCLLTI